MNSQNHKRFLELDLLRVLAIFAMLTYHTAFDLWYFFDWNIPIYIGEPLAIPRNFSSVFWWLLGRGTPSLFLLLVGISFTISWNRQVRMATIRDTQPMRHGEPCRTHRMGWTAQGDTLKIWKKFFKRGLFILSCGMLVTLATYIFDPSTYIRFGILHLIGVSILLLPLIAHSSQLIAMHFVTACSIIALGTIVTNVSVQTSLLLPLGFTPHNFTTMDYFPLFPWFGVVLIGTFIGHLLYIKHTWWRNCLPSVLRPEPALPRHRGLGIEMSGVEGSSVLMTISRSSLPIYLLHQPVILGLLSLVLAAPW